MLERELRVWGWIYNVLPQWRPTGVCLLRQCDPPLLPRRDLLSERHRLLCERRLSDGLLRAGHHLQHVHRNVRWLHTDDVCGSGEELRLDRGRLRRAAELRGLRAPANLWRRRCSECMRPGGMCAGTNLVRHRLRGSAGRHAQLRGMWQCLWSRTGVREWGVSAAGGRGLFDRIRLRERILCGRLLLQHSLCRSLSGVRLRENRGGEWHLFQHSFRNRS